MKTSSADTIAFASADTPLDPFLGAGHLNARRALTQFKAGPIDGAEIDKIGWHYGETGGPGDYSFTFADDLQAGEWVAVTLAWDRDVFINGSLDYDETYDQFDFFSGDQMSTLPTSRVQRS